MKNIQLISLLVFAVMTIIIAAVAFQKLSSKRKRRLNEMVRVYRDIVADDQLNITSEKILYDKIYALDAEKRIFVFVHGHTEPVYDIIHLNAITEARVEKKVTEIAGDHNEHSIAERFANEVYLCFLSGDDVLARLLVYSEAHDGQYAFVSHTKIAEDWQQKINAIVHK